MQAVGALVHTAIGRGEVKVVDVAARGSASILSRAGGTRDGGRASQDDGAGNSPFGGRQSKS